MNLTGSIEGPNYGQIYFSRGMDMVLGTSVLFNNLL